MLKRERDVIYLYWLFKLPIGLTAPHFHIPLLSLRFLTKRWGARSNQPFTGVRIQDIGGVSVVWNLSVHRIIIQSNRVESSIEDKEHQE